MVRINKNICVLDLGSTKTIALVVNPNKNWEIIGYGYNKSGGLKNGIITNINEVEKTILKVIESAENSSQVDINEVYFNVPAENLILKRYTSTINTAGSQINSKDTQKLLVQALENCESNETAVIHTLPLFYTLDGNKGIEEPLGMYGNTLSCDFIVISTPLSYVMNIENCLNKCQLELKQLIAEPISISHALELGSGYSIVLNVGGNCSSFSIFNNKQINAIASISLGGENITNDLVQCLNISAIDAEKIKTLHADYSAADTKQTIELNSESDYDEQTIKLSKANQVINARVDEIIELLYNKFLEFENKDLLSNYIYIVGGTTNLLNFNLSVEKIFNKETIAPIIDYPKLPEELNNRFIVTAIGMLKYLQNLKQKNNQTNDKKSGVIKQTLHWIKKSLVG